MHCYPIQVYTMAPNSDGLLQNCAGRLAPYTSSVIKAQADCKQRGKTCFTTSSCIKSALMLAIVVEEVLNDYVSYSRELYGRRNLFVKYLNIWVQDNKGHIRLHKLSTYRGRFMVFLSVRR